MKHDEDIEHIYIDNDAPLAPESHGRHAAAPLETPDEQKKFNKVLLGIFIVSTTLSLIRGWDLNRWTADFMAVFFISAAAFKFNDIESFAHIYRTYDPIAKRLRPWGYIFPFIQAFLGFWYLLSSGPNWLNVLTLLVMGSAGYGVYMTMKEKPKFASASLGHFLRLPLSKISRVEDATMFVTAAIMLFL